MSIKHIGSQLCLPSPGQTSVIPKRPAKAKRLLWGLATITLGLAAASSALAQQLINIDVVSSAGGNAPIPVFSGQGVLGSSADTTWNALTGASLTGMVDSRGQATSVGFTMNRTGNWNNPGGLLPLNNLLQDYIFDNSGTVLNIQVTGLDSTATYHLVSYTVGDTLGQGGTYSGALTGTCAATTRASYVLNDNYVEAASVAPDSSGTISFSISGPWVGFNGLQIQKNIIGGSAPKITTQPTNLGVRVGKTAQFSLVVDSGGLLNDSQWYFNNSPLPGATLATLTLTNAGPSQVGNYQVVITNTMGSVTSQVATLTLDTTTTTSFFTGGDQGEGLDLHGNASSFVLAEYYGNDYGSLQVQDATFVLNKGRMPQAGTAWGDDSLAPTFGTSQSDINMAMIANSWAQSLSAYGYTNDFTIPTVSGQTYKLQLVFHDGASLPSTRPLAVKIGGEVVESSMDPYTLGAYGTNPKGVVISYFFTGNGADLPIEIVGLRGVNGVALLNALTLQALPSSAQTPYMALAPQTQTAMAGQTVTFSALAAGSIPPFQYQWSFAGTPIQDQTNTTLTVTGVQSANAGVYTVVASNSAASCSASATLTVNTTIGIFDVTGPAANQGLDLSGNFVLAEYYGNSNGVPLIIGGVKFMPDGVRLGGSQSSGNMPNCGTTPDQKNLATLAFQNAYAKQFDFTISTVSGVQYKLQLLFHDNFQSTVGSRKINVSAGGTLLAADLDCVAHAANKTSPVLVAVVYYFTGDGNPLAINLTQTADNAILNALTLENLSSAPQAPTLLAPVAGQMGLPGATFNFTVNATGAQLSYQWQKLVGSTYQNLVDGGNIVGSLTSTLSISNASVADATTYSVTVWNTAGSTNATAKGQIISKQPSAMIGQWLSGSQDLLDKAGYVLPGTHDGVLVGATASAAWALDAPKHLAGPGIYSLDLSTANVAVAINNTATNDANYVPTFDGVISNGFSVTVWAKGWPDDWCPWVSKRGETAGWQVRKHGGDPVACFTIRGTPGDDDGNGSINSADGISWHHYAATWDGVTGVRKIYVDTRLSFTITGDKGPLALADASRLVLGARDNSTYNYGNWSRSKLFDVRMFGYALSTNEILGTTGWTNLPPFFGAPVANRAAAVGDTVVIDASAAVTGVGLTFQWQKLVNGTYVNLTPSSTVLGSTTAILTLSNVSLTDTATYNLHVSNAAGDLDCPVKLTIFQTLHAMLGHWISGPQDLTDSSAFSPAGTHDAVVVGTGALVWSSDVPAGFDPATYSSIDLTGMNNNALAITNSSTKDTAYKPTFDLNNSFSVSFWAKGWFSGWSSPYISKCGEGGIGFQIRNSNNNNKPTFTIRGTPGDDDPNGLIAVNATNWHHYAATWDAKTGVRKLYVDNVLSMVIHNDVAPMILSEANHLMIGARDQNGFGSWFKGKLFDVQMYGYAISPEEVQSISKLSAPSSTATISTVTGSAPGQGLDLQGNFVISEYYGTANGTLPISGVLFAPSTRPGGSANAQNVPNFGANPDQKSFGTLSSRNVYGNMNFTVPTTIGTQYKLQLLMHDNFFTAIDARQFGVQIGTDSPVIIDLVSYGANVTNATNVVVTYQFTATSSTLAVVLTSLRDSATLSALTLEDLSSPITAPVLLAPIGSKTNALGSTVYFSANVGGASLIYKWQKQNSGGTFVDLVEGGNVSGTTSSMLAIANLGASDVGTYQAVVSNTAGTITPTGTISLAIPPTPVMTLGTVANGQMTITWNTGRLQSTTALTGATTVWVDEPPTGSLTVVLSQTTGAKFYRVVNP